MICRDLVIALMMTTSDLCSSCKPWEKHKVGVRALFAEFHDQVRIASHTIKILMIVSLCDDHYCRVTRRKYWD